MRVAMLGSRGVPARYSGIERHIEELGARLVDAGHEVVVFCRSNATDDRPAEHRGMQLRYLPSIGTKHLDTITHTGLSTLQALRGFDVVHYHAVGPGMLAPLPRYVSGSTVVQTIHGLDGDRAKWGKGARAALKSAEWLSARVPHATITVSQTLRDHYRAHYECETTCIPNGVCPPAPTAADERTLPHGLTPGGYVLFVGRLVPEKAPHLLLEAFRNVDSDLRLVVVGGSAHTDGYVQHLEALASEDPRVVLTGPVYGAALEPLYAHAAVFVSPSLLEGGAPLTLLEAASHGVPIVASDIPVQLEAMDRDGPGTRIAAVSDVDSLAAALRRALSDPARERVGAAQFGNWVLRTHGWDHVAQQTLDTYYAAIATRMTRVRPRPARATVRRTA